MTIRLRPPSAAQNYSPIGQEDFQSLPNQQAPLQNGSGVLRFERAVSRFLREASDPALVLGMAAGQLLFAPVRAGLLHALWNPAAKRYLLGSLTSRFLAATAASTVEVPVFWGVGKGVGQRMYQIRPDQGNGFEEMASLGATMGVLRLSGFGARTLLPNLIRSHPAIVSSAASVGGLYFAHWVQEQLGWRENHGTWNRWADAVVETLQFAVTGAGVQRFLGQGFLNFQARLERQLQQRENASLQFIPPLFSQGDPSMALAGGVPPTRTIHAMKEVKPESLLNKVVDHPSFGGSNINITNDATQNLIVKVIRQGKQADLSRLKKIVFETYRDQLGFNPSERIERYFKSNDWEEWKSGIKILSVGNETTPLQVAKALRENSAFLEFVKDWYDQPHFDSITDLPFKIHGSVSRNQPAISKYFENLRQALFESPSETSLKSFLARGPVLLRSTRRAEILHEWKSAQAPSGKTLYVGHVGEVGAILEFSEKGYLTSPIHMFSAPAPEWVKKNLEAYARDEEWGVAPAAKPKEKKVLHAEIPIAYLEGTKRNHAFDQITATIRKILSVHPNETAIKRIHERYKGRLGDTIPEAFEIPAAQRAYIYNRGNYHGLILRFDEKGELLTPIHIGNFFGPEKLEKIKTALKKGDWNGIASIAAAPPEAPKKIEALFLPSPGANPTEYAARLMVESRDTSELRQQQLSQSLENLLKVKSTRDFAVEALERLESLTRQIRPEGVAVVRKFTLEGLETPLMLYKPPTISLPEEWSQRFALHLRAELQKSGKAPLLVELGSDSGWISIYLRKLGLVEESISIDPRLIGRVVGRVNALANKVDDHKLTHTRFEKANRWDKLPLYRKADWVVAAVPSGEPVLKRDGWDLVSNTLQRAHTYLSPGGRIIFGLEGVQHINALSKIFKDRGISAEVKVELSLSTIEVSL